MKNLIFLILFVMTVILLWSFYLVDLIKIEIFKENYYLIEMFIIENPNISRILFFFFYIFFSAISIPLLPSFMTVIAGALFGILEGLIIVSFASTIGACICFLVSRYLLYDYFNPILKKKFSHIHKKFSQEGEWYFLSLRLLPTIPFFVLNLFMGILPISLRKFYYISQLGMLPATLIYVLAGSKIAKIKNIDDIMSLEILTIFVLIATLPILIKLFMNYINVFNKT
jgi:uncharacterized membrane protein YdjX (TVP38/TMEM64 family)